MSDKICISLLVCNLAVIVGMVSQIVEKRGGISRGSGSESYSMTRSAKITTASGGVMSRPIEFVSTRTVDDGVNIK
ncbi:hypothetical protein H0H87_011963, partial [Tephrocybe sp. NHM501043]